MVRIITDSAADFEPFELEKLNIACVPLKVMIADAEYEENVNLGKAQFYELLASTGATPKTSQPSPQHLADLFAAAKAAGDEAVYISISSGISALVGRLIARKEIAELNRVVDRYEACSNVLSTGIATVCAILILPFVSIYTGGVTDAQYRQPLFAMLSVRLLDVNSLSGGAHTKLKLTYGNSGDFLRSEQSLRTPHQRSPWIFFG